MLTIPNARPILAADHTALGAAVKIINAGATSDMDWEMMRRASGCSDYLWKSRGQQFVDLARDLESAV